MALWSAAAPCAAQEEPSPSPSPPNSPEVLVDCPELDVEARAAIEARQMSELLSQGVDAGTLRLVCSADRVTGTWEEGGSVLDSRFLSRNQGEGAVELLHWLASVLLEMRREREASGATTERPSQETATVAAATSEPSRNPEASESAVSATAPAASAATPTPEGEPPASAATSSAPRASSPELLSLDASWLYSHFGTEVAGATGPRLGLRLRLSKSFHVGVLVDGKLAIMPSTGPSVGFSLIDVTAGISASYELLPFLSIALAPILVLSNFMGPTETMGPGGPVPAGGALLLVRGKVPWRDVRPFIELGVQAAAPARQATLNGNAVLTVPEWQAQLALGIEVPL